MGEGFIVRRTGSVSDNSGSSLNGNNSSKNNIVSGYCNMAVFLLDSKGQPVPNVYINCNDGGRFINKITDGNGKCEFLVNSGWANLYVLNKNSGGQNFIDQTSQGWYNFNAFINWYNEAKVAFTGYPEGYRIQLTNGNYKFLVTKSVELNLSGGGGGGSGGINLSRYYSSQTMRRYGGSGGSGYKNTSQISINKNTLYRVSIGSGGTGGRGYSGEFAQGALDSPFDRFWANSSPGNTGATSYFGSVSAAGGSGAPGASQAYYYSGMNFVSSGGSNSSGSGGDGAQGGSAGSPGGSGGTGNPGWCYVTLYSTV